MLNGERFSHWYYSNVYGNYSFKTQNNFNITKLSFQYLIDSGISAEEIVDFSNRHPEGIITPKTIIDDIQLWKDSLIIPNQYYSHKSLQIIAPAAHWETVNGKSTLMVVDDFWLEIKLRYTMKDLISDYTNSMYNSIISQTEKQTAGCFNFLLTKYQAVINKQCSAYLTALDLVLAGIDTHHKAYHGFINSPLDLQADIDTIFQEMLWEAKLGSESGNRKIIWRSHNIIPESIPLISEDCSRNWRLNVL
jgi:hypothetical protein